MTLFPSGHLFWGTMFIWFFVMFDMLDGAMARARGGGTRYGAVLDATCDRVADGAIFAGLAWWAVYHENSKWLLVATLICLVTSQVISYAKARAEASGLTADGGVDRAPGPTDHRVGRIRPDGYGSSVGNPHRDVGTCRRKHRDGLPAKCSRCAIPLALGNFCRSPRPHRRSKVRRIRTARQRNELCRACNRPGIRRGLAAGEKPAGIGGGSSCSTPERISRYARADPNNSGRTSREFWARRRSKFRISLIKIRCARTPGIGVRAFRLPSMDLVATGKALHALVEGQEHLEKAMAAGHGAVLALPHSGNWDMAGVWCVQQWGGLTSVAERLKPESLYERFVD